MGKEMELKYFVGDVEIETDNALVMIANRIAFVIDETKHGQTVHVHMQPQIH
jgi:hypothetical protein